MLNDLKRINDGLRKKFPNGNEPFQMVTRLAEEVGELAAEVNHFEGSGVKREKHGEPDKAKLAGEVKNVLTSALQIAEHYGAEKELQDSIATSLAKLRSQGLIE